MKRKYRKRSEAQERMHKAASVAFDRDPERYLRAHMFLTEIRKKYLTRRLDGRRYAILRERALNGDIEGARRELELLDALDMPDCRVPPGSGIEL